MLTVNNASGFGSGGTVPDATVTYVSTASQTGDSPPYTFSSQGIGTAAANRTVVVVATAHCNSGVLSAMTIGGNTATEIVYSTAGEAGSEQIGMWAYDLTTGTTATIVVSVSSGGANRCQIGVWALYGVGAPNETVVDIALALSQSITILNGGVAVAGSVNNQAGGNVTSWGSDFTERYDTFVEPNTAASGADSTGGGSKTASITWSSGGLALIAAAWPKG